MRMPLMVALAIGMATSALAQARPTDPWDGQVQASLAKAGELARTRGYVPTGIELVGALFADESEAGSLTLATGAYLILGVCDEDCRTLNLVLADPKGDELAVDRGEGNAPMVAAPSARGGRYRLRIIMGACRVSPCRYGIVVYRRARNSDQSSFPRERPTGSLRADQRTD